MTGINISLVVFIADGQATNRTRLLCLVVVNSSLLAADYT